MRTIPTRARLSLVLGLMLVVLYTLNLGQRWAAIDPRDYDPLSSVHLSGAILLTVLCFFMASWNPFKKPSEVKLWADAAASAARGGPRPLHWAISSLFSLIFVFVFSVAFMGSLIPTINHYLGSAPVERRAVRVVGSYEGRRLHGLVLESWRNNLRKISITVPRQIWLSVEKDQSRDGVIETRIGFLGIEYYDRFKGFQWVQGSEAR